MNRPPVVSVNSVVMLFFHSNGSRSAGGSMNASTATRRPTSLPVPRSRISTASRVACHAGPPPRAAALHRRAKWIGGKTNSEPCTRSSVLNQTHTGCPNQKSPPPIRTLGPPWRIDRLVGYMIRCAASVTKYSGLTPLPRQVVAGCGVLPCITKASPAIRQTDQTVRPRSGSSASLPPQPTNRLRRRTPCAPLLWGR
jgi:hypothetical protein